MEHTTLKKNGGWTIELATPLGEVSEITLAPVTLDHTIRWARQEIPSVLALIAELSGVKENVLKKLSGSDSDRLFIAFSFMTSGVIKKDFDAGARPLATPTENMSEEDRYAELDQNDELDPRFPKVNEPVQRFKTGEGHQQQHDDGGGMNIEPPDVMRQTG